ncbi:MAG: hypothetical protein JRI56_06970 [Deltaproteobacteria bacterium]|nr:hypothetical protein [Deltaproteobacteria bacterium]
MEQFCIFCGERPKAKTKEHIIPQWLIELTGDPNRKAFFGFDIISDKPKQRIYSFDSFSFPSCCHCNNEFSNLESRAKNVVLSILQCKMINDLDINCFFDWLDKVRVGLWLGFLTLSKNCPGITPKFYIKTRISAADRLLFIYRLDTDRLGINFIGTESPSFLHVPSSFALMINNYCFFNVSHFNLCDRRLGFPYAKKAYITDLSSRIDAHFVKGLERRFYPVVRKSSLPKATKFFQPVFSHYKSDNDLFNTNYVRANSIDWNKGLGKVFQEAHGKTLAFPRKKTKEWFPTETYDPVNFLPKINQQVYDFQIHVVRNAASFDKLTKDKRRQIRKDINLWQRANSVVIDFVKEQLEKGKT